MIDWNIYDIFRDIRKEKETERNDTFTVVPQRKLLFVENQWIMYNYPIIQNDLSSDVLEVFCIGIMKRWKDPKSDREELIIVGVTDTGDSNISLMENIDNYYMLVIPQHDNYDVSKEYTPDDYDSFIELIDLLHKKAEIYWKLYPGLKPEVIDTYGKVKPLNPEEHQDEMEEIKESLNQRKKMLPIRVINPETNNIEEMNYVVDKDFLTTF